jgi:hypothetical protein
VELAVKAVHPHNHLVVLVLVDKGLNHQVELVVKAVHLHNHPAVLVLADKGLSHQVELAVKAVHPHNHLVVLVLADKDLNHQVELALKAIHPHNHQVVLEAMTNQHLINLARNQANMVNKINPLVTKLVKVNRLVKTSSILLSYCYSCW